ncbi:MAG TPA: hypothetical protein VHN59_03695 [Chitinophagaceae bacterium]|nr:hypothetical protein [Chitinophagaceae bacterium]
MKRKRVLLCWPESPQRYERLKAFIDISEEIEFIHLFFRTPEERLEAYSPFRMIYWFDYKSPYALLNDIQPEKVVMGNVDDLLAISLVAACKRRGITTYGMQHGYITENIRDIHIETTRKGLSNAETWKRYFKILRFYFASIKGLNISRFSQYNKFMYRYFRKGPMRTLSSFNYEWRKADFFICFTRYSGKFYLDRDQLPPERILEIGIPFFDTFFRIMEDGDKHGAVSSQKPYYILIDTAFMEVKNKVSAQDIRRCYQELAAYCKTRGAELKVKLHPHNYFNEKLPVIPGVEYIKNLPDADLAKLISGSQACFGFYSTLCMPVVFYKKLCQINKNDVYFKEMVEKGITPVIDFDTFKADDITIDEFQVNKQALQELLEKYLYKTDGKASERIKAILIGN